VHIRARRSLRTAPLIAFAAMAALVVGVATVEIAVIYCRQPVIRFVTVLQRQSIQRRDFGA